MRLQGVYWQIDDARRILYNYSVARYALPDVQLSRFAAHNGLRSVGKYPGFDRYGRVINQMWVDGDFDEHASLSTVPNIPPIVETAYTYDNASNRLGGFDARPGSLQPLSHQYAYDGLHRLKEAKRGVWNKNLSSPSVTHGRNSQDWSLDPMGNWVATSTETNGTAGFQAAEQETRNHNDATSLTNKVNQLFQRTLAPASGGDELDLDYDFAGNLRNNELSDSGGVGVQTSLVYTHDVWDRLVKVQFKDASGTLHPRAEYEYNGLNWRTLKRADTNPADGTHALNRQTLMYYNAAWQLLEERIDEEYQSSPGIDRHKQYVWGPPRATSTTSSRIDRMMIPPQWTAMKRSGSI